MSNGRLSLSFDFETAWGDITNDRWRRHEQNGVYETLRTTLKSVLREMDTLEIPATWATVGAMIRPPKPDELDYLPTQAHAIVRSVLDTAREGSLDGRDLFEQVLSARAKHAIAAHGFSHVPFDFPGVSASFVLADLTLCRHALEQWGLTTDRLVFPENTIRHLDAVYEAGFRLARADPDLPSFRLLRRLSTLLRTPPLAVDRTTPSGVVLQSGSMLFYAPIEQPNRLRLVRMHCSRGLRRAIASNGTLHVWLHPHNLAESDTLHSQFIAFLREAADARDRGLLNISPM